MKSFTVNGQKYNAKPFSYNTVCDLEEMGVSIDKIKDKPMGVVRAYFALCADIDLETAGNEVEKHLANGGSIDEIANSMTEMVNESGFFRSLQNQQTSDPSEGTETAGKAKK